MNATINIRETKFLTTTEVYSELRSAIEAKAPYSFIRVGDGEGFVLGFGSTTSREEITAITDMWFGVNSVSDDQIMEIRSMLIEAMYNCDMLGIPNQLLAQERQRRVSITVTNLGLWDGVKPLCSAEEHMWLHQEDLYSSFLIGLDFVGVITPSRHCCEDGKPLEHRPCRAL